MREIKFRGITNEFSSPRWVYGDLICDCTDEPRIMTDYHDCYDPVTWTVDPATVGQYTGLLDNNGNEIYEGDIVKCASGRICQVVFFTSDSACCFDLLPIGGFDCAPPRKSTLWKDLTVIGNVHDDPGLLKAGGE